jgi:hypothetical protein
VFKRPILCLKQCIQQFRVKGPSEIERWGASNDDLHSYKNIVLDSTQMNIYGNEFGKVYNKIKQRIHRSNTRHVKKNETKIRASKQEIKTNESILKKSTTMK